jgi:hypothetical protein
MEQCCIRFARYASIYRDGYILENSATLVAWDLLLPPKLYAELLRLLDPFN